MYKVGDKVRIKSIDWYNENKDKNGVVILTTHLFTPGMSQFCGKIMTIEDVFEDIDDNVVYYMEEIDYDWTDEMIECKVEDECPQDFIEKYCKSCGTQRCDRTKEYLNGCPYYNAYRCKKQNNAMEEEAKPKFKVGDKVITDTNMKGKIIEVIEKGWYRVEFEPHNNIPQPNGVVPEENMLLVEEKCNYVQANNIPDITQAKTSSACSHNGFYGYSDSDGNETSEWNLPEGYQFIDENGNVINATKIVLEKKCDDDKLKLESTKKVREYWSEYARIFIEIYDDKPNECVFTHLWVVNGQRQKGYGKRALTEAETIAKELGCHTAYLKVETNSWMHQWYLRCGYKWHKNAPDNYTWLTKGL